MRRAIEPRLEPVYDHLNPPGKEDGFYADLAGPPPKTILDMGCGTGRYCLQAGGYGGRRRYLRFIDQTELSRHLEDAGLTRQVWYGNWDKSAVSAASPELIVVCQP